MQEPIAIEQTGTDPHYFYGMTLNTSAEDFDRNLEAMRGIVSSRYDQRRRMWVVPMTPCGRAELLAVARDLRCKNLWETVIEFDDIYWDRVNVFVWHAQPTGGIAHDPDEEIKYKRPRGEKVESWEHQMRAFFFSQQREASLLALEMGCGKTKVAIDSVETSIARDSWPWKSIHPGLPVLIVAPLSVLPVWVEQIEMHSRGDLKPHILRGTVARKVNEAEKALAAGRNTIIVNYESLWREPMASWVLSQDWGWVILDEAHKIKSPGSKVSRFCARLAPCSHRRLALTGTRLHSSPLDVYGIFRFLDVGLFGSSFAKFRGEFATMGGFQDKQVVAHRNLDKLAGMMDRITFSCKAADVLDLPPTQDIEHPVELSTKEYRAYLEMEGDFVAWLEEAGEHISASNALAKIIRLQQITSGYLPIPSSESGQVEQIGTSKADALRDILEGIDEPAAVFCKFRHDLATVQSIADSLGRKYCEVSGTRKDIDTGRWTEDQGDIAGIQIQAGGLGIDLTRARYGIYYSPSHSLGDYLQSRARLHRPGQDRPVTFIQLVGRQTIDEAIYQALEKKEKVIESVIRELSPVNMASE